MKKYKIWNGGCEMRQRCKNINKDCCVPVPKENKHSIECNHYEDK